MVQRQSLEFFRPFTNGRFCSVNSFRGAAVTAYGLSHNHASGCGLEGLGCDSTQALHHSMLNEIPQWFWDKVQPCPITGCWHWTGAHYPNGYARAYRRKCVPMLGYAHRYSYFFTHGTIPDGLVIDHMCNNRGCVNPTHLQAITQRANILKGIGLCAENAKKFFCKRGHVLPEIGPDGRRSCIPCRNLLTRRQYVRQKQRGGKRVGTKMVYPTKT
jgi:hypothetical protein